MPNSLRAWIIPICAIPFTPPPDNTNPTDFDFISDKSISDLVDHNCFAAGI
jgi:hypothetical protein